MKHTVSFDQLPRMYGKTIVLSHTCLLKPSQGVYTMLTKGQVVTNNLILAAQHKYTKRELDFLAKNNIVHIPMHKLVGLPDCHTLIIDSSVLDYSVLRENSHGGLQLQELQQVLPNYDHAYVIGPEHAYQKIIGYLNR